MSSKLREKTEVESFDLATLGKNEAVFLKTADNCYFISHFRTLWGVGDKNKNKVIIKDLKGNKSEMGKKAPFGKIVGSYSLNPKVREKFLYKTDQMMVTETVCEIIAGDFETIEEHFFETIKEMLELSLSPES